MRKILTKKLEQFIIDNHKEMTVPEMSFELGLHKDIIYAFLLRNKLKLKRVYDNLKRSRKMNNNKFNNIKELINEIDSISKLTGGYRMIRKFNNKIYEGNLIDLLLNKREELYAQKNDANKERLSKNAICLH